MGETAIRLRNVISRMARGVNKCGVVSKIQYDKETAARCRFDLRLLDDGALYPALQRLEQRGWISAKWGNSENNHQRDRCPHRPGCVRCAADGLGLAIGVPAALWGAGILANQLYGVKGMIR